MRGQKHYSEDKLDQAITEYFNGAKLNIVFDHFPHIPRIPVTRGTLRKRQNITKNRPGTDHVLSIESESDLVDWVIGVKIQRYPVT